MDEAAADRFLDAVASLETDNIVEAVEIVADAVAAPSGATATSGASDAAPAPSAPPAQEPNAQAALVEARRAMKGAIFALANALEAVEKAISDDATKSARARAALVDAFRAMKAAVKDNSNPSAGANALIAAARAYKPTATAKEFAPFAQAVLMEWVQTYVVFNASDFLPHTDVVVKAEPFVAHLYAAVAEVHGEQDKALISYFLEYAANCARFFSGKTDEVVEDVPTKLTEGTYDGPVAVDSFVCAVGELLRATDAIPKVLEAVLKSLALVE
jgi:hypothetical protein